jgi:phosphatidylserine/phosphatidylglycerophosphate/cardiolipin synthase-like enzyme
MNIRNIKKYVIVANVAAFALALPLFWGSQWLQTSVLTLPVLSGQEEFTPAFTVNSSDPLDLEIYDNFLAGNTPKYFQKLVIDRIDHAQKEIIIAMYSFSLPDIKQALINARNRGVKVTLLYTADNKEAFDAFWKGTAAELIPPQFIGGNIASKNYSMHHKFMLVDPGTDQGVLLTGTWNWTGYQEDLDPNLLLETRNREIIESFSREADRLQNGNNGRYKFSLEDFRPWSELINFSDARVQIWFSPGRERFSAQDRIVSLINNAEKSIDIANTLIDSRSIVDSIRKKADAGVPVRIIADGLNNNSEDTSYDDLKRYQDVQSRPNLQLVSGGQENFNQSGQFSIFHHHFMVIDGKTVMLGSANWTYGGFLLNDENFLVIENNRVAQQFTENFNYFFGIYRGNTAPAK